MGSKPIVVLLSVIAMAGCGSEPVAFEKLPAVDAAHAGEVVLARPKAFVGEGIVYVVNVDNKDVAELAERQHQRFKLAAGEHRIAIRCFGALSGWEETAITHRVVTGQTAYLAVAPKHACASLVPVPESQGGKLLSNTAPKPVWIEGR
jgi:hypothetical protein